MNIAVITALFEQEKGNQLKKKGKKWKETEKKHPKHPLCLGTCLLLCWYNIYHNRPKWQPGPVALHHYLNIQNRSLPPLLKGNCRFLSSLVQEIHTTSISTASLSQQLPSLRWNSSLLVLFDTHWVRFACGTLVGYSNQSALSSTAQFELGRSSINGCCRLIFNLSCVFCILSHVLSCEPCSPLTLSRCPLRRTLVFRWDCISLSHKHLRYAKVGLSELWCDY